METSPSLTNSFATGNPNGADGTLGKAVAGAHTAVMKAATVAEETVRKAKPVIDHVAASAHHAVDKAADVVAPTAEWLLAQGGNLRAAQQKLTADTREYVSGNALKSLAFALVAGLLIGRFMR